MLPGFGSGCHTSVQDSSNRKNKQGLDVMTGKCLKRVDPFLNPSASFLNEVVKKRRMRPIACPAIHGNG
jgi:hypothetical protein